MKTPRSFSRTILVAMLAAVSLVYAVGADTAIDWERARNLYQRSQRGEQLSAEDQAYLDRAKQARAQGGGGQGRGNQQGAANPGRTETGLVPLTDPGVNYKGEDGGLYGEGRNEPPPKLAAAAKAETAKIQPLDAEGKPSAGGKIVLLSIGMSNTTMEFSRFVELARADHGMSPAVVIVDGAQGGQTADRIATESAPFWSVIAQRLKAAGVTPAQVQVVWIKQAIAHPEDGFPGAAQRLKNSLIDDINLAKKFYPNLRVAYLSSRIYAGYASTALNPEPYAYEGAFAVRWVIRDQMKGDVKAPVALWGPYLWADGMKGRKGDSLVWKHEDFGGDGTHPGPTGRQKVAELLLTFFKTNADTRTWFLKK